MRRATLTSALVLTLSLLPAPAAAAHGDPGFEHRGGNEWWVEVVPTGSSAARVTGMEARDTDGAWVTLGKQDWGEWAASFHVEPGHDVRFAARLDDGSRVESCWFTHPGGVEQCDGNEDDASAPEDFTAAFEDPHGNAWWVQVGVHANREVASVHARVDGGEWQPLELREWGDWAASVHVPDGALVQFRAESTSGAFAFDHHGYAWPDGDAFPVPGGAFHADFRNVKGNSAWVQANVYADAPLARVDARIDAGPWQALTLRSWGDWAASLHAPDGADVRFRAVGESGAVHESGAFTWSSDGPVNDGGDGFDASFTSATGNAWWVQVGVHANRDVASVHARVDGGEWHALELQDWGDWAASFHVPEHALVQFRATSTSGAHAFSAEYVWPDAVAQPEGVWPHEGSYVTYDVAFGSGSPAGEPYDTTRLNVTLRFVDDHWEARCTGFIEHKAWDGKTTREHVDLSGAFAPPRVHDAVRANGTVPVESIGWCQESTLGHGNAPVKEDTAFTTHKKGREVDARAWYAEETPDCGCQAWETHVHEATGLALQSWYGGSASFAEHVIVDTDAPIAPGDEPPRPPQRDWPREGSFAEYHAERVVGGDSWNLTVRFEYHDAQWTGTCDGTRTESDGSTEPWHEAFAAAPPHAPRFVTAGDRVVVDVISLCEPLGVDSTVSAREGTRVHADGHDTTATWHAEEALVLSWHSTPEDGWRFEGRLLDADAPLG